MRKKIAFVIALVLYFSLYVMLIRRSPRIFKIASKIQIITSANVQINVSSEKNHKIFHGYFQRQICRQIYGKIAIVSTMTAGNYVKNVVNNAVQSIKCYAKLRGYDLYQIQEEKDGNYTGTNGWTIPKQCLKGEVALMKKRHCFIAHLLYHYDYIVHLDADTGVVNPNHCFEEYITPGIDVFLLERVHSGEIQAGHYIVRNSTYSRDFLMAWFRRMFEQKRVDNAELVFEFHSRVVSKEDIANCKQWYFKYNRCIKKVMNGQMIFKNFKVYRIAHGFVRDAWTTGFKWSDKDFLLHAMKHQDDVLFTRKLSPNDCLNDKWNLPLNKSLIVDMTRMKNIWRNVDMDMVNDGLRIEQADIADCWPQCPDNITMS
ncbi:uncharacterized protein LOC130625120 [Hydractinia symbiolongicarpus]|uniref:uncharacterized protein LOC130625120 n=1 Tax=Hydractinia symbiolongicarpus TaxID=13093 RepID=UPI002550E4B1|nr:uncharacterized protein LOC130625120 [Hydractinia symbiolongicarpus]